MEEEKTTHPVINILKTEWGYLGKRKTLFVFYITLFILAGIIELATPFIIGDIFNSIQDKITSPEEFNSLMFKISLLFFVVVLFWMFHGVARVLEVTTGFFVKKNYVNDKLRIILKLPIKWHKENHSGDTIDKLNRASGALEEFSSFFTFQITYAIISFIGSLIVLAFIDWRVGLFALVYSAITLFILSQVDKYLNEKYKKLNEYSNAYSASLFDYISNIVTVITLRLRKTVAKEIDTKLVVGYPTHKESAIINEVKWGFASIAIQLMIVIILISKSYLEFGATGTIMIGTLYMLYGYLSNVGGTFYRFAELYGSIIRSNARLIGANPIDKEYAKLAEIEPGVIPKKWKKIELKNLSFAYDSKGKTTHLDNINFGFNRGQKIALVGESGSGKSTILSLIRGLYQTETGDFYCDGKLMPGGVINLRDHVTLIPQEPEIFNNSFMYNVTMNLPHTEAEVNKAIKIAQLKPVLDKLSNGLKTSVMEKGVSLSGGEKQRLALARGVLAARKSEIVLLDEPTSSVDSINEMLIHDQLFAEFKSKTVISSIHRLHLLDKFDYIYLFSRGKIVAQGTFEEMKGNPNFSKMWLRYNKDKKDDKPATN